MNQIQKIAVDFSGENELFFRTLYAEWDYYWTTRLERSTEYILEKYNDASFLIELDLLELELGSIRESDFENHFLPVYEEQLENALLKQLYGSEKFSVRKKNVRKTKSELLFYFLLHGMLPWNSKSNSGDLNELFLEVALTEGKLLRTFLQTYGHYTSLQQRLVLQFDEAVLIKGVQVLAPAESHFVLSYVTFVQLKHSQLPSPEVTRTSHYQAVWRIVYAYLLTNRSSFFNKKSFLEQTIRQLANHYLISYPELLQLLLLNSTQQITIPHELLKLLRALKKDEEHNLSGDNNWKKWIRLLVIAENTLTDSLPEERTLLIKLLSSERNYLFLKLLREPQILKLVETVAPQQYEFVKTYARELDQQKEQGMLQGKAGGEFRLVKWQIIFPILLENTGAGFNRRHFVKRVLQKVAAHYNFKLTELLHYLITDSAGILKNKELNAILSELYFREKDRTEVKSTRSEVDVSEIIRLIQHNKEPHFEVKKEWLVFLQNETDRNRLLQQLSEKEHRQLIRILYQQESTFILPYADTIEQQSNKGMLQGKTSGNFKTLKWQFIHAVLLEPKHQVFNKKYFVEQILRRIAAHHNLKTEELIILFYTESKNKGITLPFELIKVLETLYLTTLKQHDKNHGQPPEKTEETADWIATEQLLIGYFGNDKRLSASIKRLAQQTEFIRFIEPVLQIESELRRFLSIQLKYTVDIPQLLFMLMRLSRTYSSLSKADILQKIITVLISRLSSEQQKEALINHMEQLGATNLLLKKSLTLSSDYEESIVHEEQEEILPETENQGLSFIGNAGLILLAPFLPRLFSILQLTENGKFVGREAQTRAIFLMQYAVFGHTEFPEYELQLNKLLTGFKTGAPLPRSVTLTEDEMTTTHAMLKGIIEHWNKVKTIEGLREGFLQREAKLEEREEIIELIVESKAFDVMMDSIPWNFRTTKFSWMEKTIQVKWR